MRRPTPTPPVKEASSGAVWLALWTVYILWGSTYLAIRITVETLPPLLSASARFLVAGSLLLLWFRVRRGAGAIGISRSELLGAAVVGSALLAGGNGLVMMAERDVPSGLAALIIAAVPLWVVLFRLIFGERVARGTIISVLVGFAGVGVLALVGQRPENAPLLGVVMIVGASFSWASGSFASRRLSLPGDAFVSSAWQMVTGGSLLLALSALRGELGAFDAATVSLPSWGAFAYLVVAGSIGVISYVWLLQNAPISKVATYAYVNPVIAVFLGWLLIGEQLTPSMLAGALLIVGSVAFIIRKERPSPMSDEQQEEPAYIAPRAIAEERDSA